MGNGDNFAQDVTEDQPMNGTSENGGADNAQDNGSAEAPGRDDDRYLQTFYYCIFQYTTNFK